MVRAREFGSCTANTISGRSVAGTPGQAEAAGGDQARNQHADAQEPAGTGTVLTVIATRCCAARRSAVLAVPCGKSLSNSHTYLLIHSLAHSFNCSLIHFLTHSLTHSLYTRASTYTPALTHSRTHALTHSLSRAPTHTHAFFQVQKLESGVLSPEEYQVMVEMERRAADMNDEVAQSERCEILQPFCNASQRGSSA